MKKTIGIVLVLILALLGNQNTFSHVFITDQTKTKGAILHIIPDDDPVAGEKSMLYFDMQDQLSATDTTIDLSIDDAAGKTWSVDTRVATSLITAEFVFPTQGVYKLTFTIRSDGELYTFTQSQRVSRGISSIYTNQNSHTWAELLLLTSTIGFALLLITALNRRNAIASQSTF